MNEWKCDKCGKTYKTPLKTKEVGHWCARKRKQYTLMKKQE